MKVCILGERKIEINVAFINQIAWVGFAIPTTNIQKKMGAALQYSREAKRKNYLFFCVFTFSLSLFTHFYCIVASILFSENTVLSRTSEREVEEYPLS